MPTSRAPPQWRQDSAGRWFYYRPENDTLVYQTGQVLSRPSTIPRSMLLASSQASGGRQSSDRGREVARATAAEEQSDGSEEDEDEVESSDDGQQSTSHKGKQPVRAAVSQPDRRGTGSGSSSMPGISEQMQRLQMSSSGSGSNYVLSSESTAGQMRTALAAATSSSSKPAVVGDDYTTFVADIAGRSFQGKYDTGADGNFVSMDVIRKLNLRESLQVIPQTSENTFWGIGEKPIVPRYRIHLTWRDNKGNEYREPCYVVEYSPYDLLIGSELIRSERILVPNERRSALPLKRDPRRVKEDKNLARQEQANEAKALREAQLAESSTSRAQSAQNAAGGRTLNIQGRPQLISFDQLRWARTHAEHWRDYTARGVSTTEATNKMTEIFLRTNTTWTWTQAHQYISRMLEIAQAAGYL